MNKQHYSLFFLLAACLLLSLLFIPSFNPAFGDKEAFRYIGRIILKGGVPYRDVFDHKPPLIYFLNYAVLLSGTDWTQWLLDTFFALLATGLFFRICKKYRLSLPWILPLLFNLMLRNYLVSMGMGMTREYTTILLLIFFCVSMERHRYRYLMLGIIGGLTFFIQQDQVLALVPFFVYSLLPAEDSLRVPYRVMWAGVGFSVAGLPIVLYFALHHSLSYFWQDAFLFNFGWYTSALKESFSDHLRTIRLTLDKGYYEAPFMVAVVLGISTLVFRSRKKGFVLACLASVALSFIPEFMGARHINPSAGGMDHPSYFLALSASLPILLFSVFAFTEEPVFQGWKPHLIYGVFACNSLFYIDLMYGLRLSRTERSGLQMPELDYLRQHVTGDYQFYLFGDVALVQIYNELGIVGPAKWIYHHFYYWYDNWDKDHAILYGIERDLLLHKTTYVLDCGNTPDSFLDPEAFHIWQGFLAQHYQKVILPSGGSCGGVLWKIKE